MGNYLDKTGTKHLIDKINSKLKDIAGVSVSLTTGTSTTEVMSQKAVTDALASYLPKSTYDTFTAENGDFGSLKKKFDTFLYGAEVKDEAIQTLQQIQEYIEGDSIVTTDFLSLKSKVNNESTGLDAKVNSADLATVATSGDYNDLTTKPDILKFTVGEGLILENGILKCSFIPTRYYTGSTEPINTLGNNGDIYLQIS